MTANTKQYLKDYRSPSHVIDELYLEFMLDEQATVVTATSRVRTINPNIPLTLDGQDLSLISITIDGIAVPPQQYQLTQEQLILKEVPSQFTLTVTTQINPATNTKLEGLYVSDGAFCTQCEAEGFRRITYYLDRPDVMAVYTTKIIADKTKFPYLLSNGNKVEQGELANNKHYTVWHDPHKKPAYLFALVAGDFDKLSDTFTTKSGRVVALEFFVDKGNKNKATHALDSLKRSMAWDEERFNLEYDLDIYMVVAVDFFNMGAMENKGLNVFNSKYVLADTASATDVDFHGIESVIGHEYFHNWTGNRITCRDWFQLSLKEGLTVFRDQEFSSDVGSRAVNRIDAVKVIRSHQFAEDAGPMSHPIRPEAVMEMNNFYTVTVYNKGAEVIRMMHTLVGEERFQAGMANYIERFDGQAVTCDDFVDAMETGASIDLQQFRRWYSQSGTPTVGMKQSFNADNGTLTLTLSQQLEQGNNEAKLQPFHIPVMLEVIDAQGNNVALEQGKSTTIIELTSYEQTFVVENVPVGSTAVLFGDFSAPVKTSFSYTTEQLVHILTYSSNAVSRWDSAQQLLTTAILSNMGKSAVQRNLDSTLLESFNTVIANQALDPALVAQMIELPSLTALFELFEQVEVDALISARDFVAQTISQDLQTTLLTRYQDCVAELSQSPSQARAVALRALKNALLTWLCITVNAQNDGLLLAQSQSATNMTDCIAALAIASQNSSPCTQQLLADFERAWADNGLVMDKWFATIGATKCDGVIDLIEETFEHPTFSWNNPNRVRSLIGAFAMNNHRQFHALDGRGYAFLTDQLIALNTINPQIAARLITPLMGWQKIAGERGQLMKAQLERLQALPDLAKDLVEKVELSLS